MENTNQTNNEIIITRIFDAPRELVWKAWSDPNVLTSWWGPKNFTSPSCKTDFREGGTYHWSMQSPEGQIFWTTGIFREIVKLIKIVFTDSFADEKGNRVPPSHYGMAGDQIEEQLISVSFEDQSAAKTKMTLNHKGIPAGEISDMTIASWNESFDKLVADLEKKKS